MPSDDTTSNAGSFRSAASGQSFASAGGSNISRFTGSTGFKTSSTATKVTDKLQYTDAEHEDMKREIPNCLHKDVEIVSTICRFRKLPLRKIYKIASTPRDMRIINEAVEFFRARMSTSADDCTHETPGKCQMDWLGALCEPKADETRGFPAKYNITSLYDMNETVRFLSDLSVMGIPLVLTEKLPDKFKMFVEIRATTDITRTEADRNPGLIVTDEEILAKKGIFLTSLHDALDECFRTEKHEWHCFVASGSGYSQDKSTWVTQIRITIPTCFVESCQAKALRNFWVNALNLQKDRDSSGASGEMLKRFQKMMRGADMQWHKIIPGGNMYSSAYGAKSSQRSHVSGARIQMVDADSFLSAFAVEGSAAVENRPLKALELGLKMKRKPDNFTKTKIVDHDIAKTWPEKDKLQLMGLLKDLNSVVNREGERRIADWKGPDHNDATGLCGPPRSEQLEIQKREEKRNKPRNKTHSGSAASSVYE